MATVHSFFFCAFALFAANCGVRGIPFTSGNLVVLTAGSASTTSQAATNIDIKEIPYGATGMVSAVQVIDLPSTGPAACTIGVGLAMEGGFSISQVCMTGV